MSGFAYLLRSVEMKSKLIENLKAANLGVQTAEGIRNLAQAALAETCSVKVGSRKIIQGLNSLQGMPVHTILVHTISIEERDGELLYHVTGHLIKKDGTVGQVNRSFFMKVL
jgi:hypothetical protein